MSVRTIAVAVAAAGALSLGTAAAASASAVGGSPAPAAHHHHHRAPETREFCFYSLLTETDTLAGRQVTAPQGDQGQQAPKPDSTTAGPSTGAPAVSAGTQQGDQGQQGKGDRAGHGQKLIEVVQLVKVCETTGEHGRVISVTATDESAPFAWVTESGQGSGDHGQGDQSPAGLPGPVRSIYAGVMGGAGS